MNSKDARRLGFHYAVGAVTGVFTMGAVYIAAVTVILITLEAFGL